MQQQYRYRRYNARKVHLAENICILCECSGCSKENIGKKAPERNAGKIEEERRDALRFKAYYLVEYQHIGKNGENRLNNHP